MLLLAGHPLEVLDRWSWAQVQLAEECIMLAVVDGLEMIFSPFAQAMGQTYTRGKVEQPAPTKAAPKGTRSTALNRNDPAAMARAQQRDSALLMASKAAGIAIEL